MLRLAATLCVLVVAVAAHGDHDRLGGECKTLRDELQGPGDAATKLSKFNAFLSSLGDGTIGTQFWALISQLKADIATKLTTDKGRQVIADFEGKFERGELFVSKEQAMTLWKETAAALPKEDHTAAKQLAHTYGDKIKALIVPALPASCKAPSA